MAAWFHKSELLSGCAEEYTGTAQSKKLARVNAAELALRDMSWVSTVLLFHVKEHDLTYRHNGSNVDKRKQRCILGSSRRLCLTLLRSCALFNLEPIFVLL